MTTGVLPSGSHPYGSSSGYSNSSASEMQQPVDPNWMTIFRENVSDLSKESKSLDHKGVKDLFRGLDQDAELYQERMDPYYESPLADMEGSSFLNQLGLPVHYLAARIMGRTQALFEWLVAHNQNNSCISEELYMHVAQQWSAQDYAQDQIAAYHGDVFDQALNEEEVERTNAYQEMTAALSKTSKAIPGTISSEGETCYLRTALKQISLMPKALDQVKAAKEQAQSKEKEGFLEALERILENLQNGQGVTTQDSHSLFASMCAVWDELEVHELSNKAIQTAKNQQYDAVQCFDFILEQMGLDKPSLMCSEEVVRYEEGKDPRISSKKQVSVDLSVGLGEEIKTINELLDNYLEREDLSDAKEERETKVERVKTLNSYESDILSLKINRVIGDNHKSLRPVTLRDEDGVACLTVGNERYEVEGIMVHVGSAKEPHRANKGHWYFMAKEEGEWFTYENARRYRAEPKNWQEAELGVANLMLRKV